MQQMEVPLLAVEHVLGLIFYFIVRNGKCVHLIIMQEALWDGTFMEELRRSNHNFKITFIHSDAAQLEYNQTN
jgi:hypothetical protein